VGVAAHAAATVRNRGQHHETNGSAPAGSHCPALLRSYGHCSGARDQPAQLRSQLT
jgi:hypothetical protein